MNARIVQYTEIDIAIFIGRQATSRPRNESPSWLYSQSISSSVLAFRMGNRMTGNRMTGNEKHIVLLELGRDLVNVR